MALRIDRRTESSLEVTVEGRLEAGDYDRFVPVAEELMDAHGPIALLVRIADFRGWSPGALWEDLRFDARHYRDVSRLALVGEDPSQRWMATLSKPFTRARVRFFAEGELDEARRWIREA